MANLCGQFKFHGPLLIDGTCTRCGSKGDSPAPVARAVSVSKTSPAFSSVVGKVSQSLELADLFIELRGEKVDKREDWSKELLRLFDVHSLADLKKYLDWCLADEFWGERVYIPRNFVKFLDTIIVQYKTRAKQVAKKTNPAAGCSCPRTDGVVNTDVDGGTLYDWDCLRHGHGEIPFHHYRISTARGIIALKPNAPKPPRYGQPLFEEHVKAMKKILPKPRKVAEQIITKHPILPKNSDLPEVGE